MTEGDLLVIQLTDLTVRRLERMGCGVSVEQQNEIGKEIGGIINADETFFPSRFSGTCSKEEL